MKFLSIPLIYWIAGLALVLPRIPYLGKFFAIINTVFHELGHALMALVLGGTVKKIELLTDASGSTTATTKSKFGSFLVTIIGYPFSSLVSLFIFYLLTVGYEIGFLWSISILFLLMLIFWVRNIYGAAWILLFTAANGYLIYLNNLYYIKIASLCYAVFIAVDALTSAYIILYLSIRAPEKCGDAGALKKITAIPTFFWGLFFAAFSSFIFYKILMNLNFDLRNLPY